MCFMRTSEPRPIRAAMVDNTEATQTANLEARLRRRRAGAAANVLTGPRGLSAPVARLGEVA